MLIARIILNALHLLLTIGAMLLIPVLVRGIMKDLVEMYRTVLPRREEDDEETD